MNNRIKELAVQAGFYVDIDGNIHSLRMSGEHINNELKQFVQLLLDECCDIIYDNQYSTPMECAWIIEKKLESK
jgi:hypothetical protein